MPVWATYDRINRLRSVSAMGAALGRLETRYRRNVILMALASSPHQYTWSYWARKHGISEREWPPSPLDVGEQVWCLRCWHKRRVHDGDGECVACGDDGEPCRCAGFQS